MDSLESFSSDLSSSNTSSSYAASHESVPVRIVGAVLYGILFVFTLGMYISKRRKTPVPLQSMATIFYIGLPIFMLRLPPLLHTHTHTTHMFMTPTNREQQ